MNNTKYKKELIEPMVSECYTLSELVRKLTGKDRAHGSMIAYIKSKLDEYEIDYSHFIGRSWSKDKKNPNGTAMSKEIFISNYLLEIPIKRTSSHGLKNYLFKFGLKDEKCEECGIVNWNDKKLSLHLDHKNGKHNDNRLDNLRILCPNCHSQTDNYAGKANKNGE